jgi:lysozyme family protein
MFHPSIIALCLIASSACAQSWPDLEQARWSNAVVRKEKLHYVLAICDQIKRNQARYEAVEKATTVPWRVVSSIHNMEGSLNFRTHLHNGDPLSGFTYHVPKGRLPKGHPVFSWEESAIDAVKLDALPQENWTTTPSTLLNIELYNGSGYLRFHPAVPSPYLWNWTTLQKPGKYIADGHWSSTATSDQCGVVPLLLWIGG